MLHQRILVRALLTLALSVAVTAQSNVAGRWNVTFNTDQGSNAGTMTLQQDGEKVTGSTSTDQGTLEFEGTISGNKLEWVLEIDAGGTFLEITLDGTVDGDEITGTIDLGGYGGGDWTATRVQ
ncbi:MAG TPA: hypothetical protein QF572_23030 [Vicinamibacterales bacterium]|jgi:hypothetical protein|nr:hypothetical protein [Vicinamibacterales bacterium]|tara:strand:- start:685 stop:1053 length:369 start_codon:yes stop_codon:yes gene_type:complete